jgi:penicillin amidase
MRILQRILWALAILAAVVVLVTAATAYWFITQGFPETTGRLVVPGLHNPVLVVRDRVGVPHIFADSADDLFFTQGYVHAQDRLWQMEFQRRVGHGRLSEILGEPTLKTDRFLRTIGIGRAAQADLAALDDETRGYLEAYARGVNAYVAGHADRLPVEFRLLGHRPEPWQSLDSLVWEKMMAWNLGGNWEAELLRARLIEKVGPARVAELVPSYPADGPFIVPPGMAQKAEGRRQKAEGSNESSLLPTAYCLLPTSSWLGDPDLADYRTLAEVAGLGHGLADSLGSNNWVIAGNRSTTGRPLLANDPHLGIQMPSIWYEIGLHGGGFDVVGASLPGTPGVVIGHNARIAWGITNVGPDVQDLYIEHLRSQDGKLQAEFQGRWEDVRLIHEEIKVKGREPEVLEVRLTRHGPLINDVIKGLSQPLAFKWTATAEPSLLFKAVMLLNRAGNWDEFRAALRFFSGPSQNLVYADVEGNIGYQMPGLIPIRGCPDGTPCPPGGLVPTPGWTGQQEWTGYIPFDELPKVFNPPGGVIVTANNQVAPDDYPYFISAEWAAPYRARRIWALLTAKDKLSLEDFRAIQADTDSPVGALLLPHLLALKPRGWLQEQAMAELRQWDRRAEANSPGAALAEVTYRELVKTTFADELGPDLLQDYLEQPDVHALAMERLLADRRNPWFDDLTTPGRETRDDVLGLAFAQAVDWMGNQFGDVPAEWTWGRLHTAHFVHRPLGQSGVSLLEFAVNRGPLPARGTGFTVDAAGFDYIQPYAVRSLVSYRQIIDLADLDRSLAIHTTGQSGQPFHLHYADLIARWQAVEYHPLLFSREAIQAGAADTLILVP